MNGHYKLVNEIMTSRGYSKEMRSQWDKNAGIHKFSIKLCDEIMLMYAIKYSEKLNGLVIDCTLLMYYPSNEYHCEVIAPSDISEKSIVEALRKTRISAFYEIMDHIERV